MLVGVALFEIHIEHAHSLKEKRGVVRSLRDRIRRRFDISAAEVGLQDFHQRARLGVSFVISDGAGADELFSALVDFVDSAGGSTLVGWTQETLSFDETVSLGIPHMQWQDRNDEEDA